jgi:outer membrane immunogenic protein
MIDFKSGYVRWSVSMRRFVLAAMMFGAVSGARAADMPDFPALRGGFTDGLNTGRVNWQGFYIGGQAAFGSITSGQNATAGNAALESTFVPPTGLAYQWATLGEPHATGFGYGGFAGYNWQSDDAVVGLEGNYLHTGLSAFTSGTGVTFGGTPLIVATSTFSATRVNVTDFGSARLRGGYVMGCFLPYAFVGTGFGSETVQNYIAATPGPNPLFGPVSNATKTKLVYGYSAGVGFDVMLVGGLFVRAEYEYQRVTSNIESNINSARLGVGYKF